nr:hypothetical protein BOSE7B_30131 [Bosea sp. 7B]
MRGRDAESGADRERGRGRGGRRAVARGAEGIALHAGANRAGDGKAGGRSRQDEAMLRRVLVVVIILVIGAVVVRFVLVDGGWGAGEERPDLGKRDRAGASEAWSLRRTGRQAQRRGEGGLREERQAEASGQGCAPTGCADMLAFRSRTACHRRDDHPLRLDVSAGRGGGKSIVPTEGACGIPR